MMMRQVLEAAPLSIAGHEVGPDAIEGCVARIDEATNEPQAILGLPALSLESELSDIRRLLDDDGLLASIVSRNLGELEFQLNPKCDSCVFSVHCLPESARERRLELIGQRRSTASLARVSKLRLNEGCVDGRQRRRHEHVGIVGPDQVQTALQAARNRRRL
jgi:hypothetical protein